jgi:hypothetical protein
VIEEVKTQMQTAAAAHAYEKAAALRDTWIALQEMVRQRIRTVASPDMHAADARAGIRELQRLIGLPAVPVLIEGFDISNLFGTHSVASLVAAVEGLPDRRLYRRFRIRTVQGADDPRSMAEVVGRRYARLRDEGKPLPGLLMIDGGITQLRAAREALAALGLSHLPAIGLAKQQEEIVLDDGRPSLLLPRDSDALRVLTACATKPIASPSTITAVCATGSSGNRPSTRSRASARPEKPPCSRGSDPSTGSPAPHWNRSKPSPASTGPSPKPSAAPSRRTRGKDGPPGRPFICCGRTQTEPRRTLHAQRTFGLEGYGGVLILEKLKGGGRNVHSAVDSTRFHYTRRTE